MSTTQTPSSGPSSQPDLRDLFDELIFNSGEFCSNCFARIRAPEHFEANRHVQNERLFLEADTHDTASLGTGNDPLDALFRAGDGVLGQDVETVGGHGAKRRYTPRTYCNSCGSPGGSSDPQTPSRKEMLANVSAVVSRYRQADVPINERKLKYYVRHLKSKDRFDGAEHEIWRVATEYAIENARIRDCVRATYGRPE